MHATQEALAAMTFLVALFADFAYWHDPLALINIVQHRARPLLQVQRPTLLSCDLQGALVLLSRCVAEKVIGPLLVHSTQPFQGVTQ